MIHNSSLVACLPATFLDILEACQAVTTSENLTEDVMLYPCFASFGTQLVSLQRLGYHSNTLTGFLLLL